VTDAERQAALEAIASEVADCTRCRLHAGRARAVPGEGSADTEVVFVGEGPGEQEDRQGRPFVGASGQLLTELIESLGWRRPDVYITNVVKCRPPGNRDPQPDEIAACAPFLRRQLEVLDPAIVVTVGKHSLNAFRPGERIGRVHGTTVPANPESGATNALVFSSYHPAFALYQGSNRATLFADMAGLPGALLASRARRAAASAADTGDAPESAALAPVEPAPAPAPDPELDDRSQLAAAADVLPAPAGTEMPESAGQLTLF
jgi:DNA polymerase